MNALKALWILACRAGKMICVVYAGFLALLFS